MNILIHEVSPKKEKPPQAGAEVVGNVRKTKFPHFVLSAENQVINFPDFFKSIQPSTASELLIKRLLM
ncbi:hypothetical protein HMPREF0693_1469 [Proteus mirabilis ATCC 29906]|nr:hypothetical protein HMPREF0693_1469 [Proteus mirabilis ATCC 29906]KXB99377.1 hypothetical protein HMPREF3203_02950 [Proteus mirabilis]